MSISVRIFHGIIKVFHALCKLENQFMQIMPLRSLKFYFAMMKALVIKKILKVRNCMLKCQWKNDTNKM